MSTRASCWRPACAIAASANLPAILFTLFWRNVTTQGAAPLR
jgi:Na+(H+)/acetate symporter ActP